MVEDQYQEPEEGLEAEGVEEVEASARLSPEQARELDAKSVQELGPEETNELNELAPDLVLVEEVQEAARPMRLSKNFSLSEFHCKDGTPVPARSVPALVRLARNFLQPLRDRFGPATVNSAYRTERHNRRVGGAARSYHRYDLHRGAVAADVRFARGNARQWAAEANRIVGNKGGVGSYANFVHIDNRGSRARWSGGGGG